MITAHDLLEAFDRIDEKLYIPDRGVSRQAIKEVPSASMLYFEKLSCPKGRIKRNGYCIAIPKHSKLSKAARKGWKTRKRHRNQKGKRK